MLFDCSILEQIEDCHITLSLRSFFKSSTKIPSVLSFLRVPFASTVHSGRLLSYTSLADPASQVLPLFDAVPFLLESF